MAFMRRQPPSARDNEVSIKDGPWYNKVSNFWRLVVCRNKTNEKSEVNDWYFRSDLVIQWAGGSRNPSFSTYFLVFRSGWQSN